MSNTPTAWELTQETAKAFISENYPNQQEIIDEYLRLISIEEETNNLPEQVYKFGPAEVIGTVVVPVVVGIVTNYLYDLLKSKLPIPSRHEDRLELVRALRKRRPALEKQLIKRTKNKELVQETLDYVEKYLGR